MNDLISVAEAAQITGRDQAQIYSAAKKGYVASTRVGKKIMVSEGEVKQRYANPKISYRSRNRLVEAKSKIDTTIAPQPVIKTNTFELNSEAEPVARLSLVAKARFGKYAPPLATLLSAAVDLAIADMEGCVTVREAA